MILGRIAGNVVSTIHHPIVEGRKLLVAERLDKDGEPTGGYVIAFDAIGAGCPQRPIEAGVDGDRAGEERLGLVEAILACADVAQGHQRGHVPRRDLKRAPE